MVRWTAAMSAALTEGLNELGMTGVGVGCCSQHRTGTTRVGRLLTLVPITLKGRLSPFAILKQPFRIAPQADIPLDFRATASIGAVTEARPE